MMRVTDDYYFFWKHEFGQWTMRDITETSGLTFNCCEQYMMYMKAVLFADFDTAARILNEDKPKRQQLLGREVINFDQNVWDGYKLDIVRRANYLKFSQHQDLQDRLMATGNRILVEASPYDLVWGVGLRSKNNKILDNTNWRGQNLQGKALMSVRKMLTSGGI